MNDAPAPRPAGLVNRVIRFCLEQKLVVALFVVGVIVAGVITAPFDWRIGGIVRRPVSVDAIPDIGENQQIVFTDWMGRSPRDVEDQVTYPLTVQLLGIPGVKTVRSYSMFGFSMVFVIFEEGVGFDLAQNRLIARLNGLPANVLPEGVRPALGPYATALGQVFWYTLEGRDPDGNPVGGWDPHELRSVQDWQVRFHLQAAEGVAEVASVGGFVQEYQIDVDPDAMRLHDVALEEVFEAVRRSNTDAGARSIEINKVDYLIRGRGFFQGIGDIENVVVKVSRNVPVTLRQIGRVTLGPALRAGALDKGGTEAVGGVVVVRHGYNPLQAIRNVRDRIEAIRASLPIKAVIDFAQVSRGEAEAFAQSQGFAAFDGAGINQAGWRAWLAQTDRRRWPAWATTSQVTLVPFYDRTGLIYETLGTLNDALVQEILITVIVIVIMAFHLRSAALISATLPLTVLASFIAMKLFRVDANIVSLSGIAIAIGTIVDMGIILCENILRHLAEAPEDAPRLEVVYRASSEVGGAIVTAIATTVVGFLPVFAMTGPEGKLFRPLAFTKTFCLVGSVIIALTVIPAAAHLLIARKPPARRTQSVLLLGVILAGAALAFVSVWWIGVVVAFLGAYHLAAIHLSERLRRLGPWILSALVVFGVGVALTLDWLPLGAQRGVARNLLFVGLVVGGLQGFYYVYQRFYRSILSLCLAYKPLFLVFPLAMVLTAACVWFGFQRVFDFVPRATSGLGADGDAIRGSRFWVTVAHAFPGLGKEFMPSLDEGAFLLMPTTMPHASIGEALDILQKMDRAVEAIPEVETVVGKVGRAETALDPAPVGMIETVIAYKSEYATDRNGRVMRFACDREETDLFRDAAGRPAPAKDGLPYVVRGRFHRKEGRLIEDPGGMPLRQWRPPLDPALNPGRAAWTGVNRPDDIWAEIVDAARVPGATSAPKLQPIAARLVMLQSGMRAPMGVKVKGPTLEAVERAGFQIERFLKDVPGVEASTVIADRVVGKPYLEIVINREAIARYGLRVDDVQRVIEVAVGGVPVTTTVEARARYPVRVRYLRELRDRAEMLGRIIVPTPVGAQVPLGELADIRYERGPDMIKSEDTFLVSYVLFDKRPDAAEVDVVESCRRYLEAKAASGELERPPGVTWDFAGTYQNQIHARQTLAIILPLALFVIFLIIYFQFRSVSTTLLVFSSIFVCWAGGLIFVWFYGQPWFLDVSVLGVSLRDVFQVHTINLSVAVWVGFLALFGIASDDAVVMATYLDQRFVQAKCDSVEAIREATLQAGERRIRACMMTTATTVLALLPVLTSYGRGSDIMVPMAIPSFGGMVFEVMSSLTTPVIYCAIKELRLRRRQAV